VASVNGFRISTSLRRGISKPKSDEQTIRRFKVGFSMSPRVRGPYKIKHPDGSMGRELSRMEVVDRLDAILPKIPEGARVTVWSANDQWYRSHAVELLPKPATDVPGSKNVKQWVGILRADWPKARLAGTCVCKDDSGDHCNGHRDCAACDDFDSNKNMEAQRDYLIKEATTLGVSYLILFNRIWTYGPPRSDSPKGFHPYTGDYHYHLHASFDDGKCGIACKPSSQWP
jgi:hypothetical protein